jgi:hypothetical protein
MNLLAMWIILFAVLAVITACSGIVVGIVAGRQHWPDKRIHLASWLGTFFLLALAELFRQHMLLPYPPRMIGNLNRTPIGLMITVCLGLLCFHLSERIARHTARGGH